MTSPDQHSMRSPLGKVRGLGSAHHGSQHWWAQRLTATALVPLSLWFIWGVFVNSSHNSDPETLVAAARYFIGFPVNTVLGILLVISLFHHMQLGLQVVIEDYIHTTATKLFLQIFIKFLCLSIGLAAIISILSIALT